MRTRSWLVIAALVLAACSGSEDDRANVDTGESTSSTTAASAISSDETSSTTAASVEESDTADEPADEDADGDEPADGGPTDVPTQVLAAFEAYRQTLLDADGEAAVTHASAATIDWYDQLLDHSRTADAGVLLDELPLGDAMTVVAMRGNLGAELPSLADGEALFVEGVERRLVGGNVANLQLSAVELGEDGEAFGVIDGFPVARFVEEDGRWKFDMYYTIEQSLNSSDEASVISALSGGVSTTRQGLFESLALGYGSTWAELSQPSG